jgi:hypothetical protein
MNIPGSQTLAPRLNPGAFLFALTILFWWPSSIDFVVEEVDPVKAEWVLAEAPPDGWTVGDHISLRLRVTYTPTVEVILPDLPPKWGSFEVLEQERLEPMQNDDGANTVERTAIVTLWAPGDHNTPPYAVLYRGADGLLHENPVPQITVRIASVLSEGETDRRDLKPQATLPRTSVWPQVAAVVALAALFVGGGWFVIQRHRERLSRQRGRATAGPRHPAEIAYKELDRIAALDLWRQGENRRLYDLVADCIRAYLSRRYHIPTTNQTTAETLTHLERLAVDPGHRALLGDLLREADLVKFAQARPAPDQARTLLQRARHIVEATQAEGDLHGAPGA